MLLFAKINRKLKSMQLKLKVTTYKIIQFTAMAAIKKYFCVESWSCNKEL